ncbi:retinol dehydrogenase 14-like isoform X5 [Centruroides sculpturatus]|uniref:retinol dehydrogenase 14-like isoform X5 n=1 Tax=Centruroides sculpturatus TaxID=218467 RepID=UPI000C6E473B|nr:retinol dehydrogenase 14-like isoform X5 [Centruroides sculpturatus]
MSYLVGCNKSAKMLSDNWNYSEMKQCVIWLTTGAITVGIIIKMYDWFKTEKSYSSETMKGKTVIITGANSGIGKETARELARHNAKIILACRSIKRGTEAANEIITTTGNSNVVVKLLDLSSVKSIQTFARKIIETEERLDVLINNAGIAGSSEHVLTEEGIELTLASNYFGHYVLTLLLLGVTVNSLHPGLVNTGIMRNKGGLMAMIFKMIFFLFGKSAEEGAQTSIFLAVSKDVEKISGKHFEKCKQVQLSSSVNYEFLASKLWDISKNTYDSIEKQQLQN